MDSSGSSFLEAIGLSGCGPQDRACGGDRSAAIGRLSKDEAQSFGSQLGTLFSAISDTEKRIEAGTFDAVDVARLLEFHSKAIVLSLKLGKESSVAALRANVLRIASAAYGPACYSELEVVLTSDPLAIEIVRQAESASGMRAAEVAQVHWGDEAKAFIGAGPSSVFEAAEVAAAAPPAS